MSSAMNVSICDQVTETLQSASTAVAHTRLNANSGHYTACKTFQDRYFRMGDDNYTTLTRPGFKTAALLGIRAAVRALRNETPYILIYDKTGVAAHSKKGTSLQH